jgi:hypothetical protein
VVVAAAAVAAVAVAASTAGERAAPLRVALFFALGVASCTHAPSGFARADGGADIPAAAPASSPDPLESLRAFENATRARMDFARAQTSDTALGADPYVIRRLVGVGGSFVGLLRGRSKLVELDGSLHEVARLPAPESPTGLAIATNGEVFVVGELSSRVARYRRGRAKLEPAGFIELPGVRAMRDVATGPEGVIYIVEEHDGRLLTLKPGADAEPSSRVTRVDSTLCHGPVHVLREGRAVLVDCLLDHMVVVRNVDSQGFPTADGETRIVHDGPMWGLDALGDAPPTETGRGQNPSDAASLLVAVGGVEDHPLDRTEGSFGFVDSFVTLYRVSSASAGSTWEVTKLSEVNSSELGVVTPKALKLSRSMPGHLELAVAGYGSDRLALLDWKLPIQQNRARGLDDPTVKARPIPPGSRMMALLPDGSFVIANPLLDAWVHAASDENAIVHVEDDASKKRSADSRLGEALFFTTLMAPWNKSDGRLSRFTCETCHFEGYIDGRTHYTGRGDVHATTKPLLGLLNNRPHFSRALDPDLTTMVDAEFRVAGAKSGHDPWFSLSSSDFPWTAGLSIDREKLAPQELRRALMTFLMDFTHRPNPSVVGRARWGDLERSGAAVFRDKCETCHEARLVADDPSTRVPFERWEERVMAREGAIVWARAEYEKTGVVPYVNEKGARVVSLRRLFKKYPYFTNGSAKDLASVLDRVGFASGSFFHEGAPEWASGLRDEEKAELAAFLDLL